MFPLTSRARATSVWAPLDEEVVSQGTVNGEEVSSRPSGAPSRRNWTPAMPEVSWLETVGSEAEAVMVTLPLNVCEAVGWGMETEGVVESDAMLVTVTVIGLDTVVFPAASRAVAVRVWVPLETPMVFHSPEYGGVVSSVPRLTPS